MSSRWRVTALVAVLCVAATATSIVDVAAQGSGPPADPGGSTTSTSPSTTDTTVPGDPSLPTTTLPGEGTEGTTTTTIYVPPVPPELVDDPRVPFLVDPGEGDGIDVPVAQRSFDPRSVTVLPERVAAARKVLESAQADLVAAQSRLAERSDAVATLEAELATMDGEVQAAVARAAAARKALRDHAVTAYVRGRVDPMTLIDTADFVDMGVARSYIGAVVRRHEQLARAYDAAKAELSSGQTRLAASLGEAQSVLTQTAQQIPPAFAAVLTASEQLRAYEAGAHAYVDGFVFPVAAEVEFIDSWGYPRMTGTASEHWHQGTDIFAAHGAPLVAAENGVVARVGSASLGGNKLWVQGASGTDYYYAHLSAFAAGVGEGTRVSAGDLVGYVGDTGNAKGTSPHLHFEIHPNGGDAVNPYPLLKAAYGGRPVVRAVAPTTTLPPVDPAAAPVDPAPAGG